MADATIEPGYVLRDPVRQRIQVGRIGDVEFQHRRRLRQPLRDPLHQAEPAEARQDDGRALLLSDPRYVKCDR
jgi:hypothetical protein